jgi:hypothetical protein
MYFYLIQKKRLLLLLSSAERLNTPANTDLAELIVLLK